MLLQLTSRGGETNEDFSEASLVLRLENSNKISGTGCDPYCIETETIPDDFELVQNYPNPFNPETTIEYSLALGSDLSIEIYDPLGRKVRSLYHGRQPAGTYRIAWDGKGSSGARVAAGVYICRISAGDFVKSIKMVMVE
jgi:hypothetical protein